MIAQDIIDSLKFEEGFSAHVYRDILGHASIGYGRCIEDGIGLGLLIANAHLGLPIPGDASGIADIVISLGTAAGVWGFANEA